MVINGHIYAPLNPIYQSDTSIVNRSIRLYDNKPVVIKKLDKDHQTPTDIAIFNDTGWILKRWSQIHIVE